MPYLVKNNGQIGEVLVVIPVKNEARYIARCLKAVLDQEYPPVAIVVVDNGSVDNTKEIVRKMPGVVMLEKNGTIGSVRNFGSRFVSSQYIAFLDGDCVPPPLWLQTGVELLQDEHIACVGFPASSPVPQDSWVAKTWHMMSSSAKYRGSCYVDWLSSFNLIIKRDVFEKIGGFQETLETCEDYELGVRLNKYARILFSDALTVRHLGVVSSLKEFFEKELWRGRGNLQQLKDNKEGIKGVVGILVPFFYLLSTLFLLMLCFWELKFLFLFLIIWIGLPLLLACRKLRRISEIRFLPKMIVLASVYLYARGLALVFRK